MGVVPRGSIGCVLCPVYLWGKSHPESELKLGCIAETIMVCGCPGLATPERKDSQHSWEEAHPGSWHPGVSVD